MSFQERFQGRTSLMKKDGLNGILNTTNSRQVDLNSVGQSDVYDNFMQRESTAKAYSESSIIKTPIIQKTSNTIMIPNKNNTDILDSITSPSTSKNSMKFKTQKLIAGFALENQDLNKNQLKKMTSYEPPNQIKEKQNILIKYDQQPNGNQELQRNQSQNRYLSDNSNSRNNNILEENVNQQQRMILQRMNLQQASTENLQTSSIHLNSTEQMQISMGPPSSRQNRVGGMALAEYVNPQPNLNGTGSWMDRQLQELTPALKNQLEFLQDLQTPNTDYMHGNQQYMHIEVNPAAGANNNAANGGTVWTSQELSPKSQNSYETRSRMNMVQSEKVINHKLYYDVNQPKKGETPNKLKFNPQLYNIAQKYENYQYIPNANQNYNDQNQNFNHEQSVGHTYGLGQLNNPSQNNINNNNTNNQYQFDSYGNPEIQSGNQFFSSKKL